MEKIRENIWLLVLQMVLTVIGLLIFSAFTKYGNTASIDYVNKENLKQDVVCKETKEDIYIRLNNKADKVQLEDMKKTLIIMDSRIYDIWVARDK